MLKEISTQFEFLIEDRALENDLRKITKLIQDRYWTLYSHS